MDKRIDIPQRLPNELTDKFIVEGNTLKRDVKENPQDRISVEIGDSKQPDFKPQAKIMRWDNEVNFSLRAEEHPDAIVKTEGKVVKYITPEYEVHQYELDPGDIGEDGGLEFEWVLPSKPSTNVLSATIQTKGLNFFFQAPLTQEEIDEGASRPENVEGSYAVYHATKGGMNRIDGMEYKVGKAFHIFRPKVTDANGVETWGELNIDEEQGILSVTIPQEFLDNGVYPIICDPTFGYTSIGGSSAGDLNSGFTYANQNNDPGEDGTITGMSVYGSCTSNNFEMAVYSLSGTTGTNIDSVSAFAPTTVGWYDRSSVLGGSISAGSHLLMYRNQTSSAFTYYFDDINIDYASHTNNYGTGWGTLTSIDLTNSDRTISIYATYTAAGDPMISVEESDFVDSSATNTISVTIPAGDNRGLLVMTAGFKSGDERDASGVTFGGVALTNIPGATDKASGGDVSCWYLAAPAVSTADVVVTYPATMDNQAAYCIGLVDVSQTQPDASADELPTSTDPQSISLTTIADNCRTFSIANMNNNPVTALGADQVDLGEFYTGFIAASYKGAKTPAGSVTHTYSSGGSDDSRLAMVSIAPFVEGGEVPLRTLMGVGV